MENKEIIEENIKMCNNWYEEGFNDATLEANKIFEQILNKIQNRCSDERKISKNKQYWLGACQIINEIKKKQEIIKDGR